MFLHHYFNKKSEPFRSISELTENEAQKIWQGMASYLARKNGMEYNFDEIDERIVNRFGMRRRLEDELRGLFISKGGKVSRDYPYYLILCKDDTPDKALLEFYENGDYISIPVHDLDMSYVSFTYGDSFAQYYHSEFNKDNFELVYTYDEILDVIDKNGWVSKNENGWGFVEAQLWSDDQVSEYKKANKDV